MPEDQKPEIIATRWEITCGVLNHIFTTEAEALAVFAFATNQDQRRNVRMFRLVTTKEDITLIPQTEPEP